MKICRTCSRWPSCPKSGSESDFCITWTDPNRPTVEEARSRYDTPRLWEALAAHDLSALVRMLNDKRSF